VKPGDAFVFADTLGFHAVGMVPDRDKEPKAAVAILARALGEAETADTVPTVGKQSAQVLGNEILKYIECHDSRSCIFTHFDRATASRWHDRWAGYRSSIGRHPKTIPTKVSTR
jgi:hypothetical protein